MTLSEAASGRFLNQYKPEAQLNALDLLEKWDTQGFHYPTFLSTCSHSVDKSVLWVFSPVNIQAIPYLHWLKGIRKAAAWGQVCCKTSVCTLIRTELCSGSEPHIVACIYLHVQVASPFVLCLWWLWPECRHLFPHQAMHLPSGCCFPDPFQQCTFPQAAEVWGKVYHRHSVLAVLASFPGLPQVLITYSMQKRMEKAWWILPHDLQYTWLHRF